MIEISCSSDDLASTPSNRSEYFSVTSSLNILDSNEEIYHSFDEENEPQITCDSIKCFNIKSQTYKIVKQSHLDIDVEENCLMSSNSVETIPESTTCRNSAECELWDKISSPLRIVKSQESINTFEDDINNSSIYSNSQIKESSINEDLNISSSDNEESVSISINTTNHLNSSQIEGELSDINDIIYDSSISPVATGNPIISEENDGSQIDINIIDEISNTINEVPESIELSVSCEPLESEKSELQIFELVKQLENSKQLEYEQVTICLANEQEISYDTEKDEENPITVVECHIENQASSCSNQREPSIVSDKKKRIIVSIDESPKKRSFFCCSLRKTKKQVDSPKSKSTQKSKAKKFFSFFKKPSRENQPSIREQIVEQTNNSCNNSTFVNPIDYDGIPYIDADVAIDSEDFISLAKQELFSD